MTLIERLLSFFNRSNSVAVEPVMADIVRPAAPESADSRVDVIPVAESLPVWSIADTDEIPDWLADESLLRDEGVLFGLSDSRPEDKVSMIRTYFQRLTAPLEYEVEQYNEKIGELNLFIEQKENRIDDLRRKTTELTDRQSEGTHQLLRTLAGLLFSIAMCVGNYFLIEETLRPSFAHNRWIAIGVFLAGMFSLFGRTSVFHDPTARLTFRRIIEEMGLPAAAALFIFVHAARSQPLGQAVALFVFAFFLFLLAGKLLLGNLTVLRNDLHYRAESRRLANEKQAKSTEWEREIQQLSGDIDALRIQKWQVIPLQNRAEAELHRIQARRDSLIHLFVSEYNLARSLRDRLTESERRAITLNQQRYDERTTNQRL